MPHPNNDNWMSLFVGHPVKAVPPTSVDEIPTIRMRTVGSSVEKDLPEMAEVHKEVVLRERHGVPLTAEVYVPQGNGPFPTFLYSHGGGWCVNSPEGCRASAMRIAERGFVTVNLNYSLAPEFPFPHAIEDCVYAARWTVLNAERYNGDGSHLFIGGESAGANLSAATIVALTGAGHEIDEGDLVGKPVNFGAAVLFYGVYDFPLAMREPGSNVGFCEVMWNQAYLGPHFLKLHCNPLVSPIYAPNLYRFPPTYLSCGDEDSLLGNTLAMTKALTQVNVPTTLSVVQGLDHAFANVEDQLPQVSGEFERILTWLDTHKSASTV